MLSVSHLSVQPVTLTCISFIWLASVPSDVFINLLGCVFCIYQSFGMCVLLYTQSVSIFWIASLSDWMKRKYLCPLCGPLFSLLMVYVDKQTLIVMWSIISVFLETLSLLCLSDLSLSPLHIANIVCCLLMSSHHPLGIYLGVESTGQGFILSLPTLPTSTTDWKICLLPPHTVSACLWLPVVVHRLVVCSYARHMDWTVFASGK